MTAEGQTDYSALEMNGLVGMPCRFEKALAKRAWHQSSPRFGRVYERNKALNRWQRTLGVAERIIFAGWAMSPMGPVDNRAIITRLCGVVSWAALSNAASQTSAGEATTVMRSDKGHAVAPRSGVCNDRGARICLKIPNVWAFQPGTPSVFHSERDGKFSGVSAATSEAPRRSGMTPSARTSPSAPLRSGSFAT